MKLKHNKKRNTAFLYEVLVRHLTKSIVDRDRGKKQKIIEIIKEHFHLKTLLREDLEIYKTILSEGVCDYHTAEKIIFETKRVVSKIDKEKLFNEQSALINIINRTLSKDAYSIFVPNYKSLASVQQIFSDQVPIKTRMLLETKMVQRLAGKRNEAKDKMSTVDNIVYKTFVKKFNKQYGEVMLDEQKKLLGKYINSFANNGLELKLYLNEEVTRLRELVESALKKEEVILQEELTNKIKEVVEVIDEFKEREVDQYMVEKVLKIQSLVREI